MGNGQRQNWLKRGVFAFGRDRRGNVAMMWGITAAVLVGMIGLAVDFTRAQTMRTRLQNAADGAALVAERSSNLPMAQRTDAARAFFDAELGELARDATFNVIQVDTGGHRVNASMPMPVSLARIVKNEDWEINVVSEAQAQASPPIEVVLALDNTGSMQNDMDALRQGSEELAEFLLGLDGDTVHVGLVPFVGQVNIGTNSTQMAWMDVNAQNPLHGEMLEDRYMGYRGTTSNACTDTTRYPTTYGGFAVRWVRGSAATPGYTDSSRCYAFSPSSVNIFSIYANLPSNAQWGGCVEARPAPYDINDAAPNSGTPATLFVPYFAMDEGNEGSNSTNKNNWITSSTYERTNVFNLSGSPTWNDAPANAYVRSLAVYKYRSGITASNVIINNTNGNSATGPNRGCPTPIVPLTTNRNTVVNAIRDMQHWFGGGTNQIEGLAWAWRVVSPGAPFTEGRPYNDPDDPVRKVIVLFTDGDNTSLDANNAAFQSEYSAYNFRSLWSTYQSATAPATSTGATPGIATTYRRFTSTGQTINSASRMETYMNQRQAELCTAIKAAGIEIYAIGFRITAGGSAETLLRDNCVTQDGTHYYRADNQQALRDAFRSIGTGIGQLRLTH